MRPDAIMRQRRARTLGVGGDRVVSQEDAGCLMHTSAGDADPDGTVEAPLRCFSALVSGAVGEQAESQQLQPRGRLHLCERACG